MAKYTKLQRATAAALVALPVERFGDTPREYYAHGWTDGHSAGTRDTQRRMARRFKQGLRLSWDK